MEKRALLALALSLAVFLIFAYMGQWGRQAPPPETPAAKPGQPEAPPAPPAETAPPPRAEVPPSPPVLPRPGRPVKEVVVETPLFQAVFTESGGCLKSLQLKNYRQSLPFQSLYSFSLGPVGFDVEHYQDPEKTGTRPKELVYPGKGQELPLSLGWEGKNLSLSPSLPYAASQQKLILKSGQSGALQFQARSPEGVLISKIYKFKGDSYGFDLEVKVANRTAQTLEGQLDLALTANYAGTEAAQGGTWGFHGSINRSLETIAAGKLKKLKTFSGKIDWAGLDEGYFLSALVPLTAPKAVLTVNEAPADFLTVTLRNPETVAPGQESQAAFTVYFGPKDLKDLKAVNLGLERAVDFGWFDFLAKPFLYFLKFLDGYVHNYGWAIVILTFITRLVFWYPNHKSYVSMKTMQKIQPKVAKIREKYKDDREAMNKELMALYRTFKVNPVAGCLPMALQLPVFIALYNVLSYAIELRHASFIPTLPFTQIVWLADLSAKDPLLISPVIMGASMVLQQKMTPSPGDPTQAKMMMLLPIVFTFLFLNFASGLVVYWLVNNILSIIQQYFTNKYIT
ncbi:MAG: membrane protein insertase YidC [Thermodesulfobacteriota bacterium]